MVEVAPLAGLAAALGVPPTAVFRAPVEAEMGDTSPSSRTRRSASTPISPPFARLGRSRSADFAAGAGEVDLCRYFAPNHGVDEDPVTGSNHSLLAPFGARPATSLNARRCRRAAFTCRLAGERVIIGGQAVTYLRGTITIKGSARC